MTLKTNYKYIVLGAGVSGLASALKLTQKYPGQVLIIEKDSQVGGLAKSFKQSDDTFDLGSHRLHWQVDKELIQVIEKYAPDKLMINNRRGKLRFFDTFINYPLSFSDFLSALGPVNAMKALNSTIQAKFQNSNSENYEDYLKSKVGPYVYDIFYKPYARKVWNLDPKEISSSAAKLRFSTSNPVKAIFDMLYRKKDHNKYYYTKGGIGTIAKALSSACSENKVDFLFNSDEFEILDDSIVINNEKIQFEKLISTIPIDKLFKMLKLKWNYNELSWNNLDLYFLKIKGQFLFENCETFYFPEGRYPFGRISVPRIYDINMQEGSDYTNFCFEVPWKGKESDYQAQSLLAFLKDLKLVNNDSQQIGCFKKTLKTLYPIYCVGWQSSLENHLQLLKNHNPKIFSSGRTGLFLHCNIDHSIKIGFELATHLLNDKNIEQWILNTKNYHEMKVRD